jgi:hypothetical protein
MPRRKRNQTSAPSVASEFDTDRARFIYLCSELRARIAAETDPRSIGPVGALITELDDSDLAVKLGFACPPFLFGTRSEPHFERVDFLIWNEPHGSVSGEYILHLVQTLKVRGARSEKLPIRRDQTKARPRLVAVIDAWIRAAEGLRRPREYPVMPRYVSVDVEHRLWADPFWRAIHTMQLMMRSDEGSLLSRHMTESIGRQMRRVNALANDAGVNSRIVFATTGSTLVMFDPDGGKQLSITPNPLTSIEGIKGKYSGRILKMLEKWKSRRSTRVARGDGDRSLAPFEWLARALLIVQASPELSDAEIARQTGIDKSQLSRSPQYRRAAQLARDRKEARRGFRTLVDGNPVLDGFADDAEPESEE